MRGGAVLDRSEWAVRPVAHAHAVAFIEAQHYSKGAPNTSVSRHALVRADQPDVIKGVALWMPPTKNAAASVATDWRGVLCLSRLCVAPDVPKNGASFLLGRSMRKLDRNRWHTLLTYADTAEGHTGAIYLATNWQRIGEVPGSDNWIDADGVRRGRKRGGRNLTVAEMRALGFTKLPTMPKVKFVHRTNRYDGGDRGEDH